MSLLHRSLLEAAPSSTSPPPLALVASQHHKSSSLLHLTPPRCLPSLIHSSTSLLALALAWALVCWLFFLTDAVVLLCSPSFLHVLLDLHRHHVVAGTAEFRRAVRCTGSRAPHPLPSIPVLPARPQSSTIVGTDSHTCYQAHSYALARVSRPGAGKLDGETTVLQY